METVKYRRMSCHGTDLIDCTVVQKINKLYRIVYFDPVTRQVETKDVQPFDLEFPKFADYMVY